MKASSLNTSRLSLRHFRLDDAQAMFDNWASDPEVTKFLTWETHPNVEVTRAIIKDWVEKYKEPNTYRYAITLKDSGELIGGIDVVKMVDMVPEIGYCLAKKHWNKGYMTEACKALINRLFEDGFKTITIRAESCNIGSNRVIEKCGFKFVKQITKEAENRTLTINCYKLDNPFINSHL